MTTVKLTTVSISTAKTQEMRPVRDPYNYWVNVAFMAVFAYAFLLGVLVS